MPTQSIEVRFVRLAGAGSESLLSLLSDAERERAGRFHGPELAARFIAAHATLRRLLAAYVHVLPRDIRFETGPHGKPFLPDHAVHFNMSHSGDLAAFAFSRDVELGVDVEAHRSISDPEAVARRFFAPAEVEALMAIRQPDRTAAFFRCWTRKEAYIKATGLGLSMGLGSFAVEIGMVPYPAIACSAAANWSLHHFDPARGYSAALAYPGPRRLVDVETLSD